MPQPQSQSGVVDLNDPLQRKRWMLEGMITTAPKSFWAGYRGNSRQSIIFVETDISKGDGHEVHYQFDAKVTGKGVANKNRLRGNEEQKKQFSDSVRVQRVRHGLDNGDEYDAIDIGNVPLSAHSHSMGLLADWNIEKRDQWAFDCSQGYLRGEGNTHIVRPSDRATIADLTSADTFDLDLIYRMEHVITTSRGYTVGGSRAPLEPFKMANGEKVWLWMIDATQHMQLMLNSTFRTLVAQADYRGMDNTLLKSVLGKIGSFVFVKAPSFHGYSDDSSLVGTEVEIPGLRQLHESGLYTGETGFDGSGVVASRSVILGAGAMQQADGKAPDYKWKSSDDYDITSGSAIEMYTNMQSTILYANNDDYRDAKLGGYQYGMVAVDTYAYANL